MAGKLAAVLGTGQTKYVAKRQDVSMNGLVREPSTERWRIPVPPSTTSTPSWSARRPTSSKG